MSRATDEPWYVKCKRLDLLHHQFDNWRSCHLHVPRSRCSLQSWWWRSLEIPSPASYCHCIHVCFGSRHDVGLAALACPFDSLYFCALFGCRSWFSQWVLRPFSLFLWATSSTMVSIIRWLMSQAQCSKLLGGDVRWSWWRVTTRIGISQNYISLIDDSFVPTFNLHCPLSLRLGLSFQISPILGGLGFTMTFLTFTTWYLAQVQSTPYLPDTWQADQLPPGILARSLNIRATADDWEMMGRWVHFEPGVSVVRVDV